MMVDDLPLSGFVGTIDRSTLDASGNPVERYFLFKHVHFTMLFNDDQVIYANTTSDLRQVQELKADDDEITVEYSYSVSWAPTTVR
jgi:transmembrane 9 superfamily member 1